MNENFNETVLNCITSVNALMTSNEVAKDDKAVIKLNRFKKWLNEFAAANGLNEFAAANGFNEFAAANGLNEVK